MKLLQLLEKVNISIKYLLNLFSSNSIWGDFIELKNYRFNYQLNSITSRVRLAVSN